MMTKKILILIIASLLYNPCHAIFGLSQAERQAAAAKTAREQNITVAVGVAALVTVCIARYLAYKADKKRRAELRARLAKMRPEELEAYKIVMEMDLEKERLRVEKAKLLQKKYA